MKPAHSNWKSAKTTVTAEDVETGYSSMKLSIDENLSLPLLNIDDGRDGAAITISREKAVEMLIWLQTYLQDSTKN